MGALGYHVNFKLMDGRVIAPTATTRRLLARTVLQIGQHIDLFAHGAADCHLHYAALCDRLAAGEATRRIKIGIGQKLGLDIPFAPAHYEPIRDQRHLYNTADYIWRQEVHHGTNADPLHDASNLSDLVGMRLVGSYTRANLAKYLPRLTDANLVQRLGLELRPEVDSWEDLLEAAAAAACLPNLQGRSPAAVHARAAAAQLAREALPPRRIAALLGVTERTVRALSLRQAPDGLVHAIRLQLRARTALQRKQVGGDRLSPPSCFRETGRKCR